MNENHIQIVDVFRHRERWCVVIRYTQFDRVARSHPRLDELMPNLSAYHNGYVEVFREGHYNTFQGDLPEELTFSGHMTVPAGKHGPHGRHYFVGFDSVHFHDTAHTQSLEAVRARTVALADALALTDTGGPPGAPERGQ